MRQMTRSTHRFAALRDGATLQDGQIKLDGIVFDMDGTLCKPQNYMFGEMRRALGIPKSVDIIDHIEGLPKDDQSSAWHKIEAIEREAMVKQEAQPGLEHLLEYLDRKGIRRAICTRNFDKPVAHLLEHHVPGHLQPFSPILTRGFKPPKPSPEGILHIAKSWGLHGASNMIMVGDSIDDIIAGYDAGSMTVLLASEGKEELRDDKRTDVVIEKLDTLIDLLENGLSKR